MSFKKKLLQRVAMEGLEQEGDTETPDPDTDNVTIPEGGDTPGATDETNDAGQGDGTQQDPTGEGLDGGEGSEGADPADPTGDEDEPVETGPIDLVETDELNVEAVAADEAEAADEIQEQEVRRESVDEAVGETTELVAAVEGLIEVVRSGHTLGPAMLGSMERQLNGVRSRVAFSAPTQRFAMEGMDGNVACTHLALESFRSTLRSILETIVKAIQAAVAWLTNYIKQRMVSMELLGLRLRPPESNVTPLPIMQSRALGFPGGV